ncbi:hypothetical protein QTP88_009924 [Uroleucon formosanum]
MAVCTRIKSKCPIFGDTRDLSNLVLPTYEDVMKFYLQARNQLKQNSNEKDPTVKIISEIVVTDVEKIWQKTSIPIVSHIRALQLLINYHDKYKKIIKSIKNRKNTLTFKSNLEKFQNNANDTLFDLAACKCIEFYLCSCEKSRKVPIIEQMFLKDQRSMRKMAMSSIDVLTTKKLNKNMHRKEIEANRIDKQNKKELCVNNTLETIETDETYYTDTGDNTDEDSNYSSNSMSSLSSTYSANKQSQMRLELPALALACDRTGISDRTAATIASAILQDVGIIKTDDKQHVIDRMKIRRERHKKRQDLKIQTDRQPKSLYFDGRKDYTFINQKTDDQYYRIKITEEHITLIRKPGSWFMGHCTPLHANELPLRHLFQHLDGKTSGPRGFSGALGKQLENCHKLPVKKIKPIKGNMPFLETAIDLSTDQKYLFNICVSIINGECSIDLARTNPGKQAHSRWLTTANRILRLYISTEKPEENLITLTKFILKVYTPMWFHIKMKSFCSLGSKHVWQTI